MKKVICVAAVSLGAFMPVMASGTLQYPNIRPIQKTFDVPEASSASVSLVIRSTEDVPVYRLQCHSAGYDGDRDFNYSGDFECRLDSIPDVDTYSTLLTEDIDQQEDWESRARFFADDLIGPCAKIPNFGATRSFRLRHMKLILQIIDPVIGKRGKLLSLRLRVSVKSDPSARREIAAVVPLPKDAPSNCKIRRYFPNPEKFKKTA